MNPTSTASAIVTSIFGSASKLVFLMIALTVCISFLIHFLTQENFMWVVQSVMSFYFGRAAGLATAQPPQPSIDPGVQKPPPQNP